MLVAIVVLLSVQTVVLLAIYERLKNPFREP